MSLRFLNRYEKELQKQDPDKANKTLKLAVKAMFEEAVRYKDDGEDYGSTNAFLHTYWSALLYRNVSSEWAKK